MSLRHAYALTTVVLLGFLIGLPATVILLSNGPKHYDFYEDTPTSFVSKEIDPNAPETTIAKEWCKKSNGTLLTVGYTNWNVENFYCVKGTRIIDYERVSFFKTLATNSISLKD